MPTCTRPRRTRLVVTNTAATRIGTVIANSAAINPWRTRRAARLTVTERPLDRSARSSSVGRLLAVINAPPVRMSALAAPSPASHQSVLPDRETSSSRGMNALPRALTTASTIVATPAASPTVALLDGNGFGAEVDSV
jgi:hypothetical protein